MSQTTDRSAGDVRAHLADVINAATRGHITYITHRGRRVAAIVPVPVADSALRINSDRTQ